MPRAEEAAPLVAVTPEVKQFLDGAGIGTYGYGETIMAWGYDRLHFLSDMPPDELSQLIAAMKMKRPHERKFRGALQGLGGGRCSPAAAAAAAARLSKAWWWHVQFRWPWRPKPTRRPNLMRRVPTHSRAPTHSRRPQCRSYRRVRTLGRHLIICTQP
jgi:hypothetical protein